MEENQLQEVIEKGFRELRAELDQKFGKIDGQFAKVDGQFGRIDNDLREIREDLGKVGETARLSRVEIENLRHDLSIFDEGDSTPLGKRVSAIEVRVTKLEAKRPAKK